MEDSNITMYAIDTTCGYLELIIGPMFSGKTSKLLELYKQYTYCNISVAVINHSLDNRYSDTMLSNHAKHMVPCIRASKLRDIWNTSGSESTQANVIKEVSVVLINEGQFFEDLYDVVCEMVNANKKVYICGLDGDYKRNKFGQIHDLIPMCDNVYKIRSLCGLCKNGRSGIFSKRVVESDKQTLIGIDNYIPVCRTCYDK